MTRIGRLAVLLLTFALASRAVSPTLPDTIYVNGTIVTMDAANRSVRGLAITGGLITAVGAEKEVRALAGTATRIVDLQGHILLPGFYDAHSHFPSAGMNRYSVNLGSPPMGPVMDMHGLIEALKKRASATPQGQWIQGIGYDDTLLAEMRHPTRYDLDQASTEHPIWISHTSGHLGVANSTALQLAGITKDTPQPKGGKIRKDPKTGEPNGVFEESGGMVSRLLPGRSLEQRLQGVKWASEIYAAKGVTTIVVAGGTKISIDLLKTSSAQGNLPLRAISMFSGAAIYRTFKDILTATGSPDGMIKVGAIKLLQDGSNQGYTGYFSKPYHTPLDGDANYRGYPRYEREELTAMVKRFHRAGCQIAIHGNGDAAIDDILYAFREAQKEFPRKDARHRIEHCQLTRPEQIDEIKELGITPSFFVAHVYYWGDRHRDIFMGPERAARISPLREAVERGIRFTLHNDTDVTPIDPLHSVWCAVNRLTRSSKVLGPDQRITALQALRAVTIDAAWQNFEEKTKGSIEVGKVADFVILAENPLAVDSVRIKDIPVLATVVAGKTVYQQ